MKITWILWKGQFVEKIRAKHRVSVDEVERALCGKIHVRKAGKGHVPGEDLYAAFGRTTAGRYLLIVFVRKAGDVAMPISVRDMTTAERRYYETNT